MREGGCGVRGQGGGGGNSRFDPLSFLGHYVLVCGCWETGLGEVEGVSDFLGGIFWGSGFIGEETWRELVRSEGSSRAAW